MNDQKCKTDQNCSNGGGIRFIKNITIDIVKCKQCSDNGESSVTKLLERQILGNVKDDDGIFSNVNDMSANNMYSRRESILPPKQSEPRISKRSVCETKMREDLSDDSSNGSIKSMMSRRKKSNLKEPYDLDAVSLRGRDSKVVKQFKVSSKVLEYPDPLPSPENIEEIKNTAENMFSRLSAISLKSGLGDENGNYSSSKGNFRMSNVSNVSKYSRRDTPPKIDNRMSNVSNASKYCHRDTLPKIDNRMSNVSNVSKYSRRDTPPKIDNRMSNVSNVSKYSGRDNRRRSIISDLNKNRNNSFDSIEEEIDNKKLDDSSDYQPSKTSMYYRDKSKGGSAVDRVTSRGSQYSRESCGGSKIPVRKGGLSKCSKSNKDTQTAMEKLEIIDEEIEDNLPKEKECGKSCKDMSCNTKENTVDKICKIICCEKSTSAEDLTEKRSCGCNIKMSKLSAIVESETSFQECNKPKSNKKYRVERKWIKMCAACPNSEKSKEKSAVWIEKIIDCSPSDNCPCQHNSEGRRNMCMVPINPYAPFCNCQKPICPKFCQGFY